MFSPVQLNGHGRTDRGKKGADFQGPGLIKKRATLIFWFLAVLLLSSGSSIQARTDRLKVYVSIAPQKYFVDKIGGDLLDVLIMVRPGASPATYEPKPRQMTQLAGAKIYFAIGVPFEKRWLPKIAAINPGMMVNHTEAGIEKIPMAVHSHMEKDKDNGQEHHNEGIKDPHIWLSPPLVMLQARNILTALIETDRENMRIYEKNYSLFIQEIVRLDMELRGILVKNGSFMVFHPAWGYFARAYGLEQIPVEIEGKEPKPAQLEKLIKRVSKKNIKALFVQPEFSTKSAELIAREIGGRVIPVSPLAMNWAANLKQTAQKIQEAMR